jgi:hypothetical protein
MSHGRENFFVASSARGVLDSKVPASSHRKGAANKVSSSRTVLLGLP